MLGFVLGPMLGKHTALLGEVGKVVISAIKAAAAPLLFFAIIHAILKTEVDGRSAGTMVVIAFVNTSIALVTGLVLSNVLRPGEHLVVTQGSDPSSSAYAGKKVDFLKTFVGYIPTNFVSPFADNAILSIIIIALLFGFALRRVRREPAFAQTSKSVEDAVATLLRMMEIVLAWVIKLIPLAVFGVAAKTVAENGYAPLKGLAVYVGVGLLGLLIHIVITYQAWLLIAGQSLRRFWKEAREPVVYAMGTNSSLATLPVTLQALDRLKVSKASATLGACVGTNLNNDGIVLYEGMAVLFVAQAAGIHLGIGDQVLAAVTCIVAAMGVAGVPEAGFVSLALVLNTVGLPLDILPLLLAVDWVIARGRSVTNVLSDMVLSILLDRAKSPRRSPDATSSLS